MTVHCSAISLEILVYPSLVLQEMYENVSFEWKKHAHRKSSPTLPPLPGVFCRVALYVSLATFIMQVLMLDSVFFVFFCFGVVYIIN